MEKGINDFNDAKMLKGELVLPDDDDDENVQLIAHTKFSTQDSCLSEVSEVGNEPSSPNDIIVKEVNEENKDEESAEQEEPHKPSGVSRVRSEQGSENNGTQNTNHVGERKEKAENRVQKLKETNIDDDKPLSPIEKKLSKQELFKSNHERPTNTRRTRNTQRDPFHKDRAPRKSVLKRPAEPSPRVDTIEATTFSSSPTGKDYDDDDENENKHQKQMDRKCCVVM